MSSEASDSSWLVQIADLHRCLAAAFASLNLPSSEAEVLERVDAQLDRVKQGERLPAVDELVFPGERSEGRRRALERRGRCR
jgi:hypothetical protein